MTSLMSAQSCPYSEWDTAEEFRAALAARPEHVASVLDSCLRPLVYSRHHWLVYRGEYRVRADFRSALEAVRDRDPRDWDADEAELVFCLFALDHCAIGLDELNDRMDSAAVRHVLVERHTLYAGVLAPGERAPAALLALADRVRQMRPEVERTHLPFSIIDGRAWYRTEGLIPAGRISIGVLAAPVDAVLSSLLDLPGGDAETRLRAATRAAVAADGDSAAVVRAIMRAALVDPALRADHVTLTCPMGDMLDRPQDMTTSAAFFTETQLRDGLELGEYAERLGHESADQLGRTIKARMLKLKRGAIRSLYGPGCMQGQFVEKHGGHMIFRNEDAHYRGHQSIGCSSGGRASFALRCDRDDAAERRLTPMIGDFRVVRMSHHDDDTFGAADLVHAIRYGEWMRLVIEETYRLGAVVRQDEPETTRAPAA
jgi:hypothetical protein